MNKVISKVRVTEVDGLSDALVRLYKADEGVSSDVFLKGVMDEIEKLSVFTVEAALYSSLAFANKSCAERICSKISFTPSSALSVSSSLEKSSSRLSISEDSLT